MKGKFILLCFLLTLFLLPITYSNRFWIMDNRGSISIIYWEETNVIEGNNIFVSVRLEAYIKNQTPRYVPILFDPGEDIGIGNLPAENVSITVCKGESMGHSYSDIPINCTGKVDFDNISEIKYPHTPYTNYKNYRINISKSNLKENEGFWIKINYKISNFLNDESEKLILLRTDCSGPEGSCPPTTSITKFITLPKNAAIRQYPTEAVLDTFKGRLLIRINNFTPIQTAGHPRYENKAILYTDLDSIKKREIFIFVLGLAGSLILSIILTHHYYQKSKKDNESEFLNLKQKIEGKLSTNTFNKKYKFLNDMPDKLKNLIKSKKRKYKRR
ncbi:MAG: hypothetical protein Q8R04_02765 [Nanoarchaeota archaeon]|nr:hypothetical protein [Nanoarchaeota archaeon]